MNTDEMLPMIEPDEHDPRIRAALAELRGLIAARYPDATFAVYRGEDPEGLRLAATVDVEDLDEVMDVFLARLVDLQVEEGLPVFVVLDWPIERVREQPRRQVTPPIEARLPLP